MDRRGRDVGRTGHEYGCLLYTSEPKKVAISGDIDSFTQLVWESLNEENKVSLFVRYIDIETGKYETRIVNKNH